MLVGIFLFASVTRGSGQQLVYVTRPENTRGKYSSRFTDAVNAANYTALLSFYKGLSAGLYAEKRFMLRELSLVAFSVSGAYNNSGATLLFQQFGGSDYKETIAGIGYARRLGSVSPAAEFRYLTSTNGNGEKASATHVAVSALVKSGDDLSLFVRFANPHLLSAKSTSVRAASAYCFGVGWQASAQVYAGLETLKEEAHCCQYHGSVAIYVLEFFSVLLVVVCHFQPTGCVVHLDDKKIKY